LETTMRTKLRVLAVGIPLLSAALAVLLVPGVREAASVPSTTRDTSHEPSSNLPDLRKVRAIDRIDVARYANFWSDWKLVTVRYRKDNGEQRFVYANDIAWRAMREGRTSYPEGAMFGKVAFSVVDDPSFPNSMEPTRFTRIQLMKKDSSLYGSTDGWGYALILRGSKPEPDTNRATAATCHGCHRVVPERDFVFSNSSFLVRPAAVEHSVAFKARFREQQYSSFTEFEKNALKRVLRHEAVETLGAIRSVSMDLFEGSVNESIGVLARYASEDGKVYALWDERSGHFIVARPLAASPTCKTKAWVAVTVGSGTGGKLGPPPARVGIMCDGVWQSVGTV
jgi:hypothetical protein